MANAGAIAGLELGTVACSPQGRWTGLPAAAVLKSVCVCKDGFVQVSIGRLSQSSTVGVGGGGELPAAGTPLLHVPPELGSHHMQLIMFQLSPV